MEKAIDTRSSMGALGDMGQYTRYQTATAIPLAAANPGGMGSIGVGLGAGMAMGNQMGAAMASSSSKPPPIPAGSSYYMAVAGKQAGPFDMSTLSAKVASGDLKPDTLVWKDGMSGWSPAQTVEELKAIFPPQPPPIPS